VIPGDELNTVLDVMWIVSVLGLTIAYVADYRRRKRAYG